MVKKAYVAELSDGVDGGESARPCSQRGAGCCHGQKEAQIGARTSGMPHENPALVFGAETEELLSGGLGLFPSHAAHDCFVSDSSEH
jgi:hypothetical protein